MRKILEYLDMRSTYESADTVNEEGFSAWQMDDQTMLEQLAMTGTLGRSFYASGRTAVAEALALMERVNAEDLANAIVHGRNDGFIRTFPILGLAVLSSKDSQKFQAVFPEVIKTGNDLEDFINIVRKMRGCGRSIKKAIHNWLTEHVTPYYAMKYRSALADAIRVSRFAGDDPIYAYILAARPDTAGLSREKIEAVYSAYTEFAARREFLKLLEEKQFSQAAELMLENKLDIDSLSAYYDLFDKEVWNAVAQRAPVMKFIKYLAKFKREGVELDKLVDQKLTVENLQKAKVFPFRLYPAFLALEESGEAAAEHLKSLLDDYSDQYDWSSFNKSSWVIAPDMSGSMHSSAGSGCMTYADISGMFTAFFARGLDNVTVIPWDTKVLPYDISVKASVMEQISYIKANTSGGTYMEAPVKHMIKNKIMADRSVFITDTEEYGDGWLASWQQYRKLNPKAQAILLRVDSYHSSPYPPEEAAANGIWEVFGWNDSVIDYIKFIIERN